MCTLFKGWAGFPQTELPNASGFRGEGSPGFRGEGHTAEFKGISWTTRKGIIHRPYGRQYLIGY